MGHCRAWVEVRLKRDDPTRDVCTGGRRQPRQGRQAPAASRWPNPASSVARPSRGQGARAPPRQPGSRAFGGAARRQHRTVGSNRDSPGLSSSSAIWGRDERCSQPGAIAGIVGRPARRVTSGWAGQRCRAGRTGSPRGRDARPAWRTTAGSPAGTGTKPRQLAAGRPRRDAPSVRARRGNIPDPTVTRVGTPGRSARSPVSVPPPTTPSDAPISRRRAVLPGRVVALAPQPQQPDQRGR